MPEFWSLPEAIVESERATKKLATLQQAAVRRFPLEPPPKAIEQLIRRALQVVPLNRNVAPAVALKRGLTALRPVCVRNAVLRLLYAASRGAYRLDYSAGLIVGRLSWDHVLVETLKAKPGGRRRLSPPKRPALEKRREDIKRAKEIYTKSRNARGTASIVAQEALAAGRIKDTEQGTLEEYIRHRLGKRLRTKR
jgi:hypothetical protein